MATQSVLEGQAAGKPSAVVDSRPVYSEELEMIVGIALEPVRRLLHLMEYGDQEDVNDGPTGHAGAAAGALLDSARAQIESALGVVQDSLGGINVRFRDKDTMGHMREFVGVEFKPRSGGQIVAASPGGTAKSKDRDALERAAVVVWESSSFLHESFISSRREDLAPAQVCGLKNVLFDLSDQVNEMGRALGKMQMPYSPPLGRHVPSLAAYTEQAAATPGELYTAVRALRETFAFLDAVFISDKGDLDDESTEGLRRILHTIHAQVGALEGQAEAGIAGEGGEAKPNRVVPFKAPATPAESAPAQKPTAAASSVRFARDLDPEAEPAPAPRRGLLSWLNPRNWR